MYVETQATQCSPNCLYLVVHRTQLVELPPQRLVARLLAFASLSLLGGDFSSPVGTGPLYLLPRPCDGSADYAYRHDLSAGLPHLEPEAVKPSVGRPPRKEHGQRSYERANEGGGANHQLDALGDLDAARGRYLRRGRLCSWPFHLQTLLLSDGLGTLTTGRHTSSAIARISATTACSDARPTRPAVGQGPASQRRQKFSRNVPVWTLGALSMASEAIAAGSVAVPTEARCAPGLDGSRPGPACGPASVVVRLPTANAVLGRSIAGASPSRRAPRRWAATPDLARAP